VGFAHRTILAVLLHCHLALLDTLDAGVGDPFDMLLAHLAFEQVLGVADAVEAEVADIRLGGHKRHRDPIAQLAAAQLGLQDEQELVGRAKAGRALNGADHHGARICR